MRWLRVACLSAVLGAWLVVVGARDSSAEITNPGLAIYGQGTGAFPELFGYSVAHGDFNGDAIEDIIVHSPFADGPPWEGRGNAGEVNVILGSQSLPASIDTAAGQQSFTIYGPETLLSLGADYSNLSHGGNFNGDVNATTGHHIDDIVVGSPSGGKVYVIPGRADLGAEDGFAGGCGDSIDNGLQGDGFDQTDSDCYLDLAVPGAAAVTVNLPELVRMTDLRDINNNGYADLVIGVPNVNQGAGAVYVVFGSAELDGNIDVTITGQAGEQLGYALNARNVTGTDLIDNTDKFADLLIGAPGADGDTGRLYMFRGRSTWPGTLSSSNADFTFLGDDAGDRFGEAVYSGDVNGDRFNDLLIGATMAVDESSPPGVPTGGAAYLFDGSSSLAGGQSKYAPADARLTMYAQSANVNNGISVHTGALTDDRYEDIIIGNWRAPGNGLGKTWAIRGGASLAGTRHLSATGQYDLLLEGTVGGCAAPSDALGWWTAAAELNGDGLSDLLTSAPYADGDCQTGSNPGAVYAAFDADLDGTSNEVDIDDDNDGICDAGGPSGPGPGAPSGCSAGASGTDNCRIVVNPAQDNHAGSALGDACEESDVGTGDSLGLKDGPLSLYFRDAVEVFVGTDPAVPCDNGNGLPDWPPDFDNSKVVDINDLFAFLPHYPSSYPEPGYAQRYDLDADGDVDGVDFMILRYRYWGKTCT